MSSSAAVHGDRDLVLSAGPSPADRAAMALDEVEPDREPDRAAACRDWADPDQRLMTHAPRAVTAAAIRSSGIIARRRAWS